MAEFISNFTVSQVEAMMEEAVENSTVEHVDHLNHSLREAGESAERTQSALSEFIQRYFNTDALRTANERRQLRGLGEAFGLSRSAREDEDAYRDRIRHEFRVSQHYRPPSFGHPLYYSAADGYPGIPVKSPISAEDTGPTVKDMEADYRV